MGMGGDLAYQWLTTSRPTTPRRSCSSSRVRSRTRPTAARGATQRPASRPCRGARSAWTARRTRPALSARSTCPRWSRRSPRAPTAARSSPSASAPPSAATRAASLRSRPPSRTSTPASRRRTPWASTTTSIAHANADVAGKVINVPGCPTNPWWFVLSVVCLLVDIPSILSAAGRHRGYARESSRRSPPTPTTRWVSASTSAAAWTTTRRLKAVYGNPIHGPYCPRYRNYVKGVYASQPGDPGCLQKIGCKGPAAKSLCGLHGWNNQQPTNPAGWDYGVSQRQPRSQRHDHDRRPLHSCWPPLHGVHREGLSGQLRTVRGALEILERREK